MQRRRPWKRSRVWTCNLEEPSGVGGAECCDSRRWNKGGLRRSEAHILRHLWYKPWSEVRREAAGEVGGGHSTSDRRDNRTRQEGRTSASTVPSEAVSDGACPCGPITPGNITTTPAQAMPEGQEGYNRLYRPESVAGLLGPTASVLECHGKKVVGKPYAGEPHVRFEVAGVGNVATVEL